MHQFRFPMVVAAVLTGAGLAAAPMVAGAGAGTAAASGSGWGIERCVLQSFG